MLTRAAHIALAHQVNQEEQLGTLTFFTCDPDEEQEAHWLAGCLLLPRSLLVEAMRTGRTVSDIARENGVSEQMAAYRFLTTGVEKQVAAARTALSDGKRQPSRRGAGRVAPTLAVASSNVEAW